MNKIFDALRKNKYLNSIIIDSTDERIIESLKDIMYISAIEQYNNLTILLLPIEELDKGIFTVLMDDLGLSFRLIYGIHFSKKHKQTDFEELFSFVKGYFSKTNLLISKHLDFLRSINRDFVYNFCFIDEFDDLFTVELIKNYFENDLNVLKTSKDIYLSRTSILFRLNSFYKSTSFNIQKFSEASFVYELMCEYHKI